ncbi:MAG: hypothetical protein QOC42_01925 [Nitrososphaeraceae archaeon]|nr:hypothetical protein [Nitrososphaeraceae archaeon]
MMKKAIYFGSVALVLAFALFYVSVANAQNVTTNASNAMGNASANASQEAGNMTNKTGGLMGGLGEKLKEAIGGK